MDKTFISIVERLGSGLWRKCPPSEITGEGDIVTMSNPFEVDVFAIRVLNLTTKAREEFFKVMCYSEGEIDAEMAIYGKVERAMQSCGLDRLFEQDGVPFYMGRNAIAHEWRKERATKVIMRFLSNKIDRILDSMWKPRGVMCNKGWDVVRHLCETKSPVVGRYSKHRKYKAT